MSTTVSYKGATLTTVTNQTTTLETSGTWLEDDITLVDVTAGGSTLGTKSVTANGTYTATDDSLDGYSQVTVAVPASAVDTGTKSITTNGTHDVIGYASANVAVPASAVDSGTKSISITTNGTTSEDVTGYATASITTNVANSYDNDDEGKVVSSGALVSQTSDTVTANDTYDTTLINSLTVNVSGGGGNDDFEDLVNGSLSGAVTITTATAIRDSVFLGSTLMTSISSDTVTRINNAAFYNCTGLQSASFPNVTSFGGNQNFHGCSSLSSIYFPKLSTDIPNYAFRNCTSLVNVVLQKAVSLNTGIFQGCTGLQSFDVGGNGGYFGQSVFNSTALNTLVIRSTSVKSLGNINAFASTPFASGGTGGTIYVPSSLISSYQSASNWSTLDGYGTVTWVAIEGSQYENYYADGTAI